MGEPAKAEKPEPSTATPPAGKPPRPGFFYLLTSAPARHARALARHVQKILNHQRDILSANSVTEVGNAVREVEFALAAKADKAALETKTKALESAANKWLKPYPNASLRENVEVLLVALTVAMAVRTFFLQPFKIPTGSMQPTLWGVTSENLSEDTKIPTGLDRIKSWLQGSSYVHIVAPEDGTFDGADEAIGLPIFKIYQRIYFNGKAIGIWFPPDYGSMSLAPGYRRRSNYELFRSNARPGQTFRKGETVIKLKVNAGDHLFVDRVSYNFRPPERGEIIVFETQGIEPMRRLMPQQGDTFYIKRLVGLGGESLQLERDYSVIGVPRANMPIPVGHLVVDGQPLSASTPHFANLYSYPNVAFTNGMISYHENEYCGHAMLEVLAPGQTFSIGTNSLFVLGDNTMNSLDSRMWGDFPKSKVIGKSWFVYWPITTRFGWGSSSQ